MLVIHGFDTQPDEEIAEDQSIMERLESIDAGLFDSEPETFDSWPFHDSALEPDPKDVWL